jgi:hypothetical protein
MKTATPETDYMIASYRPCGLQTMVPAAMAKRLELERNQLQKELDLSRKEIKFIKKQLEQLLQ